MNPDSRPHAIPNAWLSLLHAYFKDAEDYTREVDSLPDGIHVLLVTFFSGGSSNTIYSLPILTVETRHKPDSPASWDLTWPESWMMLEDSPRKQTKYGAVVMDKRVLFWVCTKTVKINSKMAKPRNLSTWR